MDGQTQKKTVATKSVPVILHLVYLKYHKIELNIIYGWQIVVFTIGFCVRHNAALINVKWNCCLARWLYKGSTPPSASVLSAEIRVVHIIAQTRVRNHFRRWVGFNKCKWRAMRWEDWLAVSQYFKPLLHQHQHQSQQPTCYCSLHR